MPTHVIDVGPAIQRRIRLAMQKARDDGMTWSQLEELTLVDVGYLRAFKRGTRPLSLQAATRVCTALGMRLTVTLEVVGRPAKARPKLKPGPKPRTARR